MEEWLVQSSSEASLGVQLLLVLGSLFLIKAETLFKYHFYNAGHVSRMVFLQEISQHTKMILILQCFYSGSAALTWEKKQLPGGVFILHFFRSDQTNKHY